MIKDELFGVIIFARLSKGTVTWRLEFDIAIRGKTKSVTFRPHHQAAFVTTAAPAEEFDQRWLAGVASSDDPPYLVPGDASDML